MSWMILGFSLLLLTISFTGLKWAQTRLRIKVLREMLSNVTYRRSLLERECWDLQGKIQRLEQINWHAWRMETDLRNRLAEFDPEVAAFEAMSEEEYQDWQSKNDPDYGAYMEAWDEEKRAQEAQTDLDEQRASLQETEDSLRDDQYAEYLADMEEAERDLEQHCPNH